MKKSILLILMLFILTGCNAEYNLTINENSIYENVKLFSESLEESYILELYNKPIEVLIDSPMHSESNEKLPGVEYYNINKNINNGLYQMNINYEHKFGEYKNSNIINNSVSVLNIKKSNGIYIFNTGATLKIFENYNTLNKLTIKINIDSAFEIVNNNADEVLNNEYIWHITRNDYKASPITLSLKKINNNDVGNNKNDILNNQINNNEVTSVDYIFIIFSLVGFISVLLIIIILSKKTHK